MSKQSYIEYLYEQKNKKGGSSKKILEVNIKDFNEFFKEYEKAFKNGLFKKKQSDFNKTHQLLMSLSEQKNIDPKIKNIIMKCISLYDSAFNTNFFNKDEKTNEIKKVIINPNKSKITINPNKSKITKNIKKVKPISSSNLKKINHINNRKITTTVVKYEGDQLLELQNFTSGYENGKFNFIKWENVEGDGNCFFRAIAQICFGNQNYHQRIRDKVVQLIENSNGIYFNSVLNISGFKSKKKWLDFIKTNGSWGGTAELNLLIPNIVLYIPNLQSIYFHKSISNRFQCEGCYGLIREKNYLELPVSILGHINDNHWIYSYGNSKKSLYDKYKNEIDLFFS